AFVSIDLEYVFTILYTPFFPTQTEHFIKVLATLTPMSDETLEYLVNKLCEMEKDGTPFSNATVDQKINDWLISLASTHPHFLHQLLTHQASYNADDQFITYRVTKLMPVLEYLAEDYPDSLFEIFNTRNVRNLSALHSVHCFESAIPLLQKLKRK